MKHEVAVRAPCIQCLTTTEGTQNLRCGKSKALLERRKARNHFKLKEGGRREVGKSRGPDEERENGAHVE